MNNYAASLFRVENKSRELILAVVTSVLFHIVALVIILLCSYSGYSKIKTISVIDVDLMAAPAPKKKPATTKAKNIKKNTKKVQKKKKRSSKKTKKTVIPSKKKKTKKKTRKKQVKPEDLINNAINRLQKDLEKTKPDPIAERMKELKKTANLVDERPKGKTTGALDKEGSATVLDRYRYNISMAVWENWAFSEHLTGGKKQLETRIVFNVMPGGEIGDIRFTKRSGNSYMDSAASMAIVKSSPVRGHPPGVSAPFVEVKLSFTPEGLK